MEGHKEKSQSHKKCNQSNGFYRKYLSICRHKNIGSLSDIKKGSPFVLDLFIDRIDIDNWLAIIESLSNDSTLATISLKLRKRSDYGNLFFLFTFLAVEKKNPNFFQFWRISIH